MMKEVHRMEISTQDSKFNGWGRPSFGNDVNVWAILRTRGAI